MAARVRPMTDETVGTCDWGRCDDETIAERFDAASDKWLGVCRRHNGGTTDRRESPGRGACPGCGKDYALSVEGRLRAHNRGFAERCPGSGARPSLAGAA